MSKPTPLADLYRWHSEALADLALHLAIDTPNEPQCGWFKRKLVKGGVFVPARIWMHQPTDENGDLVGDEVLQCEVNGRYADAQEQWQWLASNPISEADFNFLAATIQWSQDHAPDEPMAHPRKPVDWLAIPTPTFERKATQ